MRRESPDALTGTATMPFDTFGDVGRALRDAGIIDPNDALAHVDDSVDLDDALAGDFRARVAVAHDDDDCDDDRDDCDVDAHARGDDDACRPCAALALDRPFHDVAPWTGVLFSDNAIGPS